VHYRRSIIRYAQHFLRASLPGHLCRLSPDSSLVSDMAARLMAGELGGSWSEIGRSGSRRQRVTTTQTTTRHQQHSAEPGCGGDEGRGGELRAPGVIPEAAEPVIKGSQ
jgi:hypothetical protein